MSLFPKKFLRKQQKREPPEKLLDAQTAYEQSKPAQIANAIKEINETIRHGSHSTHICNQEKPCDELLNILREQQYDVHIHAFQHGHEIFTKVTFDGTTTGRITFDDTYTKAMFPNFDEPNDIWSEYNYN